EGLLVDGGLAGDRSNGLGSGEALAWRRRILDQLGLLGDGLAHLSSVRGEIASRGSQGVSVPLGEGTLQGSIGCTCVVKNGGERRVRVSAGGGRKGTRHVKRNEESHFQAHGDSFRAGEGSFWTIALSGVRVTPTSPAE